MRRRDKLALISGGIAVVLIAIFQYAIFPIWDDMQEKRANLVIQEKKLEKYREVVRTAGLQNAEVNSVEARIREAEGGLLTSKTAALASAELQELVSQITSAESIDIRSSDFSPVKPLTNQYTQVPLGLQFQCRLDQLVNLLNRIATSEKYLAVPRLVLQSTNIRDKTLSVNMQIAAFMRAEARNGEARSR